MSRRVVVLTEAQLAKLRYAGNYCIEFPEEHGFDREDTSGRRALEAAIDALDQAEPLLTPAEADALSDAIAYLRVEWEDNPENFDDGRKGAARLAALYRAADKVRAIMPRPRS